MVAAYAFLSVFIVSLVSLIGVIFLSFQGPKLQKALLFLVSFAVGGLIGDAFIHLVPQAYAELGDTLTTALLIMGGVMLFFALEKFIRWRHCHVPTSEQHVHPVATLNLVGDGVHNLIDGMLIGASYMVNIPLGITTTLAVLLHEIPQEIGDFSILVHAGFSTKKALLFNFLTALTSLVGAGISLLIGTRLGNYSSVMLAVTAGGFIYIAGSDLIPELHDQSDNLSVSILQFFAIVGGIGLMSLLLLVE
ncbi:MAG: ZIP family metal transporter [Dehalococcoidales bacterium]|nr:ZIP family metal transporter [Dehalococcoidales bacterium]